MSGDCDIYIYIYNFFKPSQCFTISGQSSTSATSNNQPFFLPSMVVTTWNSTLPLSPAGSKDYQLVDLKAQGFHATKHFLESQQSLMNQLQQGASSFPRTLKKFNFIWILCFCNKIQIAVHSSCRLPLWKPSHYTSMTSSFKRCNIGIASAKQHADFVNCRNPKLGHRGSTNHGWSSLYVMHNSTTLNKRGNHMKKCI